MHNLMLNHIYCFQRGLATGIYTTNSPEACQYVSENCEANVLVVENHKQLIKILQVVSNPVYIFVYKTKLKHLL